MEVYVSLSCLYLDLLKQANFTIDAKSKERRQRAQWYEHTAEESWMLHA
jgi:hypothetical protein